MRHMTRFLGWTILLSAPLAVTMLAAWVGTETEVVYWVRGPLVIFLAFAALVLMCVAAGAVESHFTKKGQ